MLIRRYLKFYTCEEQEEQHSSKVKVVKEASKRKKDRSDEAKKELKEKYSLRNRAATLEGRIREQLSGLKERRDRKIADNRSQLVLQYLKVFMGTEFILEVT